MERAWNIRSVAPLHLSSRTNWHSIEITERIVFNAHAVNWNMAKRVRASGKERERERERKEEEEGERETNKNQVSLLLII